MAQPDSRAQVVVIGSANVDLVVPVEYRPSGGETVLGGELAVHPGGKGANQAVAAARLGGAVSFVGCLGDDAYAAIARQCLDDCGVSAQFLRTTQKATGVALITVTPDGENSIIVAPGANGEVGPADVEAAAGLFGPQTVVVMQLEIPQQAVDSAVRQAAQSGARVILNAAPARELPAAVLAAADPLVVNESEAGFYLGHPIGEPGPVLAEQLRSLGARSVVVTLGAAGAYVVSAGAAQQMPSPAATVVDTTGAGDAFVGAIATELSRGADLLAAVRFGVRVGAVTVSREGAQTSFPVRAEVGGT